MSVRQDTKVVAGIFRDEKSAAEAVKKLIEEHFDPRNDLEVIASHRRKREHVRVWQNLQFARGAKIGSVTGAVLGVLGATIAGLDFGPLSLAQGPIAAVLEAAFAGACVGFALGALFGIDMADMEADFDAARVHDGVIWVGVNASGERAARARRILAEAGARHFMERAAGSAPGRELRAA
jgi:hypothetical protein